MFCSKCGNKLDPESRFCTTCGAKTAIDVEIAPTSQPRSVNSSINNHVKSIAISDEAARQRKKYRRYKWLAVTLPLVALLAIVTVWGVVGFLGELNLFPQSLTNIIELLLPVLVTLSVIAIPVGMLAALGLDRRQNEATLTSYDERSGKGDYSVVPEEIKGWNWGAFALGIIWGLRHNIWLSILTFVPIANLVYPFVAGVKGSEWAWRRNKWESVAAFKRSRRKWNIAGLILLPIFIVLGLLGAIIDMSEQAATQYGEADIETSTDDEISMSPSAVAQAVVEEFNKTTTFPEKIDEVTYLANVMAVGAKVVFMNEVTEEVSAPLQEDAEAKVTARKSMKEYHLQNLCDNEDIREILAERVTFQYRYYSKAGELLFEVFVGDGDCPAATTVGS